MSFIIVLRVTSRSVAASEILRVADSKMGAVFKISTLDDVVHIDHTVPSLTRTSTAHTSPLVVIVESTVDVEIEVMMPSFHHRYCVSMIESMSASEEVDEATSASGVFGLIGVIVMLSTVGAVFDV